MFLKLHVTKSLNFFYFFKNFFILDFDNIFYFFFSNLFFFYNFSLKIKENLYKFFWFFFSKKYLKYLYNFISYYIISFCNFFFIEMFLDGLYYRIKYYKKHNVISFILGYNHYILYTLPKNVYIKIHMKKRRFFLYSMDKTILSKTCNDLVNLKYPNLFKGKGVKVLFFNYRLKLIKKKK